MKLLIHVVLVCFVLAGTSIAADSPTKIPVILDTDIGTDIDDAFALALIINSPEFELLGVTTVSGDTAARARIAAKMLWEAGGKWRQVPVVAGVPGPKARHQPSALGEGLCGTADPQGKRRRFSAQQVPPLSRANHADRHRRTHQRGGLDQS